MSKVHPNGVVEVWSESIEAFMVNGQWLNPYFVKQPIEKAIIHTLTNPIQA